MNRRNIAASILTALVIIGSPAVSFAQTAPGATLPKAPVVGSAAPADEYFGRLSMSILGIRNQLNKLGGKVDANPSDTSVLGMAKLVEQSIADWEYHYPSDSWISGQLLQLLHVYAHVDSPAAHTAAVRTFKWIVEKYPAKADAAIAEMGHGAEAADDAKADDNAH